MGSLVAELAEKLSSATNNFDIDDGTIYVNTSADTVGIGTTTPGSKLDVQGTVTADGLTVGSDNTILKEVNNLSLTISGSTTDSTGGNITLYGDASGGTSRIRFRNDATEAMRIEGNGDISFYEDTGTTPKFFWDASAESLGIGTSSPAYALDIQSGDIRIEDSDANKPALFFTNTDGTRGCSVSGSLNTLTLDAGDTDVATGGTSTLLFKIDSTERMRIDSSGNVGIGTTAPSTLTHIDKSSTTAFSASDASWHDLLISNRGTATNHAVGIVFQVSSNSNGYAANAGTGIAAVKNGDSSDYGADLVFITRPQSAIAEERMRIADDGKVGIGTTAPATKLEVSDNQAGTPIVTIENTTANEATIRFKSSHSAYSDYRVGASISSSNAFEIYSVNSASSPFIIDQSGNVGIGTTPSSFGYTPSLQLPEHTSIFSKSYLLRSNSTSVNAGTETITLTGSYLQGMVEIYIFGGWNTSSRYGYAAYRWFISPNSISSIVTIQSATNVSPGNFTSSFSVTGTWVNADNTTIAITKPSGAIYTYTIVGYFSNRSFGSMSASFA